jgi:hypothetical protein
MVHIPTPLLDRVDARDIRLLVGTVGVVNPVAMGAVRVDVKAIFARDGLSAAQERAVELRVLPPIEGVVVSRELLETGIASKQGLRRATGDDAAEFVRTST